MALHLWLFVTPDLNLLLIPLYVICFHRADFFLFSAQNMKCENEPLGLGKGSIKWNAPKIIMMIQSVTLVAIAIIFHFLFFTFFGVDG